YATREPCYPPSFPTRRSSDLVPISFFYEDVGAGARTGGFADGQEPPPVMEFLSSGEGLQLSLAFMRIRDTKVRRRILELVRSLRSEEHTSELQSRGHLVCRLL